MKKFGLLFLYLIMLFFPAEVQAGNSSPKKGVGQDWRYPMTHCNLSGDFNSCVVNYMNKVESLGISWLYFWGITGTENRPEWLDPSIEFVPMVFHYGDGPNHTYTKAYLDSLSAYVRKNPNSHWLIWNEPDSYTPIDPVLAAGIYDSIYQAIKLNGYNATIIVGGLLYFPPSSWINTFINTYKDNHAGSSPPLNGWAFHYYRDYSSSDFRGILDATHTWLINNGYQGKEFWLTEFGNLSSNEAGLRILQEQQEWLEKPEQSWITRYAWFYSGVEEFELGRNYKGNLLSGSLNNLGAAQLSTLGIEYALHPTFVPSSTPVPCPRGNLGNLDCTSTGKIDASDLDILLGAWGSPASTAAPDFSSANLDNQNGIDASDLDILLSNWGLGS